MQSAETVLGVLRERGRRGLPLEELYRQLFNPQLYLLAYGRIYANKGAMTPGASGETADGMSLGKIGRIIDALRHERYRFSPVKRVYIPKKSGRSCGRSACRPGRTSWSARWCACCLRRTTSRSSLTDRTVSVPAGAATPRCGRWRIPGPGQPGSLRVMSLTVSGVSTTKVMVEILAEKIHDNRFLRLMRNMLKAGYLEDWRWNATLSGVPQGGVVSPVLSNIYLHKLDNFVETVLIPEYTRGRVRKPRSRLRQGARGKQPGTQARRPRHGARAAQAAAQHAQRGSA